MLGLETALSAVCQEGVASQHLQEVLRSDTLLQGELYPQAHISAQGNAHASCLDHHTSKERSVDRARLLQATEVGLRAIQMRIKMCS